MTGQARIFHSNDSRKWNELNSLDAILKFVKNKRPVETLHEPSQYEHIDAAARPYTYVVTWFDDDSSLIMETIDDWADPETGTFWEAEIQFYGRNED